MGLLLCVSGPLTMKVMVYAEFSVGILKFVNLFDFLGLAVRNDDCE